MQRQRHQLIRAQARPAQRADELVGRRATTAALRGIQLQQRHRMRGTVLAAGLRQRRRLQRRQPDGSDSDGNGFLDNTPVD